MSTNCVSKFVALWVLHGDWYISILKVTTGTFPRSSAPLCCSVVDRRHPRCSGKSVPVSLFTSLVGEVSCEWAL